MKADYKIIKTFGWLIELEYGKMGSEKRNKYEEGAQMFIISEMLKFARKEANLMQEQLANFRISIAGAKMALAK